jgi:hypothetical protein
VRRVPIVLGVIVVVLVVGAAILFYTGVGFGLLARLLAPSHGWDLAYKVPAPDYADPANWAALPSKPGLTALVPAGTTPSSSPPHDVDVFFIHPTGYLNGQDWNSPLDPNSATEDNTKWMMANQASVFDGCCDIYAPRYREASIFVYLVSRPDIRKKALDFAYGDVARAFDYFLAHYSHGRPFIIASHSQGTAHAFRLIKEKIDGTPLASRMVAAYLIGGGITDDDAATLKTVRVCASASDTHCFVHWATWGEGGRAFAELRRGGLHKFVCVNPLSWERDGGYAGPSLNHGAVVPSGRFTMGFLSFRGDRSSAVEFPPLPAPRRGWTHAECQNGILLVSDQSGGPFGNLDLGGKNYHGLDYPLFHVDIRDNAVARVKAYLTAQPSTAPAQ